jgi:hypothetical protein
MNIRYPRGKDVRGVLSLTLACVLVSIAAWFTDIGDAQAIPAFARKYDMTCNACHTRQPRLNTFGQRFLENGYQLPGTEDGGVTLKRLLGGETGGATLDDVANIMAVRLRADVQKANFKEATEATDDVDIVFPNIINLFFAGTATENVSYFLEGEYATQEGHDAALAFERAFMMFDNIGGHQVANVKIGQFDPSAFYSFPTHRQQLNPIPPDAHTDEFAPEINRIPLLPLAFSSKMFGLTRGPGVGGTDSTGGFFDPGAAGPIPVYEGEGVDGLAILPFEPMFYNAPYQKGVSVHGRPFGPSFLYQVGVVQEETADDEPDTRWDPYAMLRYDRMMGDYSALQVSGFYYQSSDSARASLAPPPLGGEIIYSENTLDWERYGFGARWQYKYLDLYGTVIWDEIDKPTFGNAVVDTSVWETDAMGVSIEADWLINQNWMLGARYDYMQTGGLSVLPVPFRTPGDAEINQDASFLGVIAKYYPVPNIALYGRAHFNLESSVALPAALGGDENPATNLESMFTVGVDMAF